MKFRHGAATIAIAAAALLVLSGCGASGAVPAGAAKTTLNLSVQAPTADLSVGNFTGGDPSIFLAVFDRLVTQGVDGALEPGIAESWEYTAGNTVLTFHIRDGQTFSDGEALNADAVVQSIEVARTGAASAAQLSAIESVAASDESTVVITLSRPDGALIYQLAGTNGVIAAPKTLGTEASKLDPIGSGPYVLDQAGSTVGSVYLLKKNPDHWNAAAYKFESVKVAVIADPTAVQNALKTGQLDFGTLSSPDLLSQFPESDFHSGTSNPSAVGGLFIVDRKGLVVPALADIRVRQAINLAIDRDTIVSKLTPGVGTPTSQMASPIGEAYDESLTEEYAYNVDKAKQLMADAGYADGFSLTMPSTVLSQTFDATIAQQLSDIGITVNYETVPFQDLYAKLYAGAYGMFWLYNGYGGSDAKDMTQILAGSFNPQGTTTPELEALLATANSASLDDQGAAYGAVNKYYVDNAWFAPVTAATGIWVASNAIDYTSPVVYGESILAWQPAN
ncbi:ABC transporter substrate-binding protein [Herbiconiux sp. 11R-BC]|uniref:ABC transporter substrate-binding protein n=1 Tax=Herbiconiux sp. 11R-BC TaxID=3111637 RepID=UPI003C078B29